MSWSIGEIASLAIKAARGAGMEWGIAQEAGHAVSWLERNGVSGVSTLAAYLQQCDREEAFYPHQCPLHTGTLISDTNNIHAADGQTVYAPLLLAPFIAQCLEQETIRLTWKACEVLVSKNGILTQGSEVQSIERGKILVEVLKSDFTPLPGKTRISTGAQEAIDILDALAHKTYAPATEASRISGAGAGLNDND